MFTKAEIDNGTALQDDAIKKNALYLNDQTGKKTRPSLWFTPGNDVFGYKTRSERIIKSNARQHMMKPFCNGKQNRFLKLTF